jgi:hypothetical protein
MATTTHFILTLNAKAVTMLQQNDDDMLTMGGLKKAAPVFRQAVQAVASSLAIVSDEMDASTIQGRCTGPDLLLENVPVSLSNNDAAHKASLLEESFSPDNTFCFYSKAFFVIDAASSESSGTFFNGGEDSTKNNSTPLELSTAAQLQLSATILYNWVLACHSTAICTGSSSHIHMTMKLYNKALVILTTGHHDEEVMLNNSLVLLYLALCNNLGHCSSYLSDEATSQKFQEFLESGLATISVPTTVESFSASAPSSTKRRL